MEEPWKEGKTGFEVDKTIYEMVPRLCRKYFKVSKIFQFITPVLNWFKTCFLPVTNFSQTSFSFSDFAFLKLLLLSMFWSLLSCKKIKAHFFFLGNLAHQNIWSSHQHNIRIFDICMSRSLQDYMLITNQIILPNQFN